ncbi:MAG: ABC transporter ATP-binding protein [Rhodocyclales bacterium]|nr:ABC transporter ATP-binding protein [Rhodocyclales bacterium]
MLEVRHLHVDYNGYAVLKDVSLSVTRSSITVLVGLNGAGKSTLLKAVSGLKAWSSGDIVFAGTSIAGEKPAMLVSRGLLQVPEGRHLFPRMTVLENLELGGYLRSARQRREDLERMFHLFPVLRERTDQLGGTMSGGQQQMLAIARALMGSPKLLVLDEPSLGLAPLMVAEMFRMIAAIRDEGVSVLLVEQNVKQALAHADYAYVIDRGCITLEGPGSELAGSDEIHAAYFGTAAH